MSGNSFGKIFTLTTFGESHGIAIGGVVDGCPAGLEIDVAKVQFDLDRRKPGQSAIVTQRKEADEVEFLSGIFEGKTTGAPIGFLIRNTNQKSKDYSHIAGSFRPSHADYTYETKYGHRDYRGGGRQSARETASRVVGGAIAKQLLAHEGSSIQAYVSQVASLKLTESYQNLNLATAEENDVRCPDAEMAKKMDNLIREVKEEGDTIGGVVTCVVMGVSVGLGSPVFDKLHADLGKAMLSINAVKGFEYGSGFAGIAERGSKQNDLFVQQDGVVKTSTNNSGGIQGGISNGNDIYFNVAFKPVATIMQQQESVDKEGNAITVEGKGRHDACVVPRAVVIVEAMAALTLTDHFLRSKSDKI